MDTIHIYTDGACSVNPGPGGYGIIMEWVGKPYRKEFSEGFRLTTNNRMELMAVIVALEKLKHDNLRVIVHTDSLYVTDAVNKKWIYGWHKKRYEKVKNPDLWKRFYPLYLKYKPEFIWIKGHTGHPQNERCDRLAVAASKSKNLSVDYGYEQSQNQPDLFS